MTALQRTPAQRWLAVCDIDDTLTGDAQALQDLAHALNDAGKSVVLAVNSSRPAASVAATLAQDFPDNLVPDAVVTALGTEISVGGTAVPAWQSRFSGWPHDSVFAILAAQGHQPHDPMYQTAHKVSFAVPKSKQADARRALSDAGIGCDVITSGHDDFDVLPRGAGKASATLFLAQYFGIDQSCLVVAGDSGNDLDMFLAAPNRIAVANARTELIDALPPGSFYHARHPFAAGVHEGFRHFGMLPSPTANTRLSAGASEP